MKNKILISGSNPTLLKDFFLTQHDDNICLSTSEYWEDVKGHIQAWQPDAYVCLIEDKNSLQLSILKNIDESLNMRNTNVVIITNEDFYPYFSGGLYDNVELVLCKPLTINEIFRNISEMLRKKENERLLEEQKQQETAAKEVPEKDPDRVRNILVVDDDKNVLKLLKTALDGKYNVSTMITGKMAEKFLESRSCDLILLDYEMPVENGPEVFRKIKEIETAKDIPIVFLTGVAEKEKIAEVLRLKPQGYLLKPIDMEKLLEVIENTIL